MQILKSIWTAIWTALRIDFERRSQRLDPDATYYDVTAEQMPAWLPFLGDVVQKFSILGLFMIIVASLVDSLLK